MPMSWERSSANSTRRDARVSRCLPERWSVSYVSDRWALVRNRVNSSAIFTRERSLRPNPRWGRWVRKSIRGPLLLLHAATCTGESCPCANFIGSHCGSFCVGYVVSAFAESWPASQDVPAPHRGRPSGLAHRRDPPSEELPRLDDRWLLLGHNPVRTRNSNRTSSSNPPTRCSPRQRWETSPSTPET